MNFQHQQMAAGRWQQYSLLEQLGNIGSEVGRANRWKDRDPEIAKQAFFRALELLDLTLSDPRWKGRCKEIARAREVLCDAFEGGKQYDTDLNWLEKYFAQFAYAARNRKL